MDKRKIDPALADKASATFAAPQNRIEAFVRLQHAMLTDDRPQIQFLSQYFGSDRPLELQICEAVHMLNEGGREGYRRLSQVISSLARTHSAHVVASTFGKPDKQMFSDLDRAFVFSGTVPVDVSERMAYFNVPAHGRQTLTCKLDHPSPHGVFMHFLGYIHSGTADHFLIRLIKDNQEQEESVRLGARGVTLERSLSFLEMPGPAPRLVSVLVEPGWVDVYINGMRIWRHARPIDSGVKAVAFDLRPFDANSTDAVMLGFEIWRLDAPYSGEMLPDPEVSVLDALEWHFNHDNVKEAYTLVTSVTNLDLGPIAGSSIAFMTRLAAAPHGYLDWAVRSIEPLLPRADQQRWEEIAARTVPDPVIQVENLSVKFHKNFARASHIFGLIRRDRKTFNVLENINFSAYPGDVIGIIGHNGAGKSTFLRTLAGLIPINQGHVRIRDDFMLLRGGLGIRPHLTGRENVVSAGIYMGLTPMEARARIDDILEFSELGEHFERPTKYYSDGMMSRLVFAIATSVSPEILLLDELLGAGDISFQEKATRRLNTFIKGSRVVVVVTHSIDFVRKNCNKALVLARGKQLYFGEPVKAVSVYLTDLNMSLGTEGAGNRF